MKHPQSALFLSLYEQKKTFLPPMFNFFSDGLNLKQTAGLVNGVEGVFTGRIFPILKLQNLWIMRIIPWQ